jgi:MFS family permease
MKRAGDLIFRRVLGNDPPSGPSAVFAWTALLGSTGNGVFAASATLFLTRAVHLSVGQASVALSVAAACSIITTMVTGKALDRGSPRTVMIVLCALRAAVYAALAVVSGYPTLVVVLCLATTLDLLNKPAKQTLMGVVMADDERRKSFALQRSISNVAFSIGALIAGIGASFDTDLVFRSMVLINALLFVPMILMYARLPSGAAAIVDAAPDDKEDAAPARSPWRDAHYVAFSACSGMLMIYYALLFFGLPLWVTEKTAAPLVIVSATWILNTAVTAVGQARWAERVTNLRTAVTAYALVGLTLICGCAAFYVASLEGALLASASILVGGLFLSVAENIHTSAEYEVSFGLAPAAGRNAYFSMTTGFGGISEFLGPLFIGAILLPHPGLGWGLLAAIIVVTSFVPRLLIGTEAPIPTLSEA